jgi:L-fuculose-phosphate aldolase
MNSISSKSPKPVLKAFFNSPAVQNAKEQLCDIGRRMWQREYVDGNGGNLALRVGKNVALCTPTLVSKGFMRTEDICLVDFEGNQLAGTKKRTSEISMHLQILKRQPKAIATCHCHPPHATSFAVAGVLPPSGLVSEFELFVSLTIVPYRTPGTPELGRLVAKLADQHNTILLANHGVVSWSHNDLEDAYFKIEILETYCQTVLATKQLGVPARTMTPTQLVELLKMKKHLGIPDPRHGLKESQIAGLL